MASVFLTSVLVYISMSGFSSSNPLIIFLSVLRSSLMISVMVWAVGSDLEGFVGVVATAGCLLAAFGFMLSLIPWKMAESEELVEGKGVLKKGAFGASVGVPVFCFFSVPGVDGKVLEGSMRWAEYSSALGGGLVVGLGALLIAVMILIVSVSPSHMGAMRRWSMGDSSVG
uniref:NADH dehydrogenase subunit 6 n=1 Tax=Pteria penguin TaxID=113549 RepID=A0A1P8CZ21_PTEPN|nr:NADH dehydrogenase subunit 6 [Pteria penguin]